MLFWWMIGEVVYEVNERRVMLVLCGFEEMRRMMYRLGYMNQSGYMVVTLAGRPQECIS